MKLYRFVKFCERNFFQKGNRLAQLILFFWISMFFCFLIFFAPCFWCHPGLDPGSLCFLLFFIFWFFLRTFCHPRLDRGSIVLDSRFHGNDIFLLFSHFFSFLGGFLFEFFFL